MTIEEAIQAAVRAAVREELAPLRALLERQGHAASPADDGYLSVAEAAELAKVSKNTIRAWIGQGRLPRRMAGRELRVQRRDLHRLMAQEPEPAGLTPEEAVARLLGG